jgi:hypothetical protein
MPRSRSGALFGIAALLVAGCGPAIPPAEPPPTVAVAPEAAPASTVPLAPTTAPTAVAAVQPDATRTGTGTPRRPRPTRLDGTSIRFEGGDGSSMPRAIVILGAKGERDGVDSEYQYLEMMYGPRGDTWNLVQQSLLDENGKKYDRLDIKRAGGQEAVYFDITDYFGKF